MRSSAEMGLTTGVGAGTATLAFAAASRALAVSRVRDADGAVWQQVQWQSPAQIVLVRYRGTLDELLKIAGSMND